MCLIYLNYKNCLLIPWQHEFNVFVVKMSFSCLLWFGFRIQSERVEFMCSLLICISHCYTNNALLFIGPLIYLYSLCIYRQS